MNTDEILANMDKRIAALEHHCHPMTGHAATYTGDVEPCESATIAPGCRKDVADAWRNCPILADSLVNDIYRTAMGQTLREQDFKAVSYVISLAYHLGRETERKPSDVASGAHVQRVVGQTEPRDTKP